LEVSDIPSIVAAVEVALAYHGPLSVAQPIQTRYATWPMRLGALASALMLVACSLETSSPGVSSSPSSDAASPSESAQPSTTPEPSPSEGGGLTLPDPSGSDPNPISTTVAVEIAPGESGRLVIVVTNLGQEQVQELVLRWPTAVRDTVFLAPFEPTAQRIREGGDPLVQEWTRWVDGPGEQGEPAGTTSLGWGPLLVGGTLTIPVLATRVAPGPITFDLQVLSGEKILQIDGEPAFLKVTVP
jgi:hypothetical protein